MNSQGSSSTSGGKSEWKQPTTDEFLEPLLKALGPKRPELEAEVRAQLGPVLERLTDRKFIREDLKQNWSVTMNWPITNAQDFSDAVLNILIEYHRRVIDPLLGQLVGEIIVLNASHLATRRNSRGPEEQSPRSASGS